MDAPPLHTQKCPTVHICSVAALLIGMASLSAETAEFVERQKSVMLAHVALWLTVPVFAQALRPRQTACKERAAFWLLLWAWLAYALHFVHAVFGVFGLNEATPAGALRNALVAQGAVVFFSNLLLTVWWPCALLLYHWRRARWVRVQHGLFLTLLFIAGTGSTLFFAEGASRLTGLALVAALLAGASSRLAPPPLPKLSSSSP